MHCLSRYEALWKFREQSNKVENDRPSPEIPHDSRTNSRVLARVCDVEGGTICSKNSTFVSITFEDGRVNKRIFQESGVKYPGCQRLFHRGFRTSGTQGRCEGERQLNIYNPFSNPSFLLFCIHHHKVYERQNKSYTRDWVTILSIYVILIAIRKEKLIGLQGDKAIETSRSNFAAHMISDNLLSLHCFAILSFRTFEEVLFRASFLWPLT